MERIKNVFSSMADRINWYYIVLSVLIIAVMIALMIIVRIVFKKLKKKANVTNPNAKTAYKVVSEIIQFFIILLAVLFILSINGVDVGSLFAGLGIASAIVGLALQDILKDIVMGVRIITDGFFVIGDSVKYKEYEGTIVAFGLRSTRLRCLEDDRTVNICNRNIDEVVHIPKKCFFDLDVPLSYEDDVKMLRDVMNKCAERIENIPEVNQCHFIGTQDFNDSSVSYRLRVYSSFENSLIARRSALGAIQDVLAENNVIIPYNQLDIHKV